MRRIAKTRRSLGAMAIPVAGLLTGALLAGCGSGGSSTLVRQACDLVAKANHLRLEAASAPPGRAAVLQKEALHQLVLAGPYAAIAAGGNSGYQALAANLEEVNRVPTYVVFPALRADCSALS